MHIYHLAMRMGNCCVAQNPKHWQNMAFFMHHQLGHCLYHTLPNAFDYMSGQKNSNHGFESSDSPVPTWCPMTALRQKARVSLTATDHTHFRGFLEAGS